MATYDVLILGASYGSLLATKLLFGGHKITMVCLPAEVEAFNSEGARIRLPIRGRKDPIELDSRKLPGKLSAAGPSAVDPSDYDLVVLAMQEPQYRSPDVRELLDAVARKKVPCMSIMNMPPLPYLSAFPAWRPTHCGPAYTDACVGQFRSGAFDLMQSGPAGDPSARRKDQCAAGDVADQFQGGPLRLRHKHRDTAPDAGRDRSDPLRCRGWSDRPAGQAQGARLDLRPARQMGDAADRQLPLRDAGPCHRHQGCCAQRPRRVALGLRLGVRGERKAGSVVERSGAVREIRQRRNGPRPAILCRAGIVCRRTQHRADRPAGTDDRGAIRHAQRRRRSDGGDSRRPARGQSQGCRLTPAILAPLSPYTLCARIDRTGRRKSRFPVISRLGRLFPGCEA